MTDWILPNSGTPGPVTGDVYMDAVQAKIARASQGINIQLSGIGGTANNITATLDPAPISGLANGMLFVLPVSVANTGAVTLAINGGAAANVVDLLGSALTAGRFPAGSRQLLTYSDGAFIAIGDSRIVTNILDYQAFTTSGTWTKPVGTPGNAWVFVEGWGGGGGGRTNSGTNGGGGGGGAYRSRMFRASQIPSSAPVIVGAGGAVNSDGTNSSFGSLIVFTAGKTGSDSTTGAVVGGVGGEGGNGGGYTAGASGGASASSNGGRGGDNGGGGGGGYATVTAGAGNASANGGDSYYGGGGGGGLATVAGSGTASANGGASIAAGAGGARGQAGFTPAGGGGRGAAGARGEVRVWVVA